MTSLLTHSRAETLTLLKDQHEIHQTQKIQKGKNTKNLKIQNTKTQKGKKIYMYTKRRQTM